MADEKQQTRQTRTRRSRRQDNDSTAQANADTKTYDDAQTRLAEIDNIISDIVTPSNAQDSVTLGGDAPQDVQQISNEELVNRFRQQGGQ